MILSSSVFERGCFLARVVNASFEGHVRRDT